MCVVVFGGPVAMPWWFWSDGCLCCGAAKAMDPSRSLANFL